MCQLESGCLLSELVDQRLVTNRVVKIVGECFPTTVLQAAEFHNHLTRGQTHPLCGTGFATRYQANTRQGAIIHKISESLRIPCCCQNDLIKGNFFCHHTASGLIQFLITGFAGTLAPSGFLLFILRMGIKPRRQRQPEFTF